MGLTGLAGIAVLAVIGYHLLPKFVLARIEAEAAARGVTLTDCELQLSLEQLVLEQCQFSLERSADIRGRVAQVTITLESFRPTRVDVVGADVQVVGTPEFDELFAKHKPQLGPELPVVVTGSELSWRRSAGDEPQLHLSKVEYRAPEGSLAADVNLSGAARGKVTRKGEAIELSLSVIAHPEAKLHARIQQDQALGELRIDVQGITLADLESPFLQVGEELGTVEADLLVYAQIPIGLTPKPAKGDFRATLRGLNFPVPRELHGLVYGTPLELGGNFVLDRSFTKAKFDKLQLSVGALRMRGKGTAELSDLAVAFETSLSGELSCDAIVRSAAAAHVSTELAKAAGRIARQALEGSVTLVAFVKGRSDQLDRAEVIKSVGVGCGLKTLPLPDLTKLPRELLERLPKLEDLLPPDGKEPPKLGLPSLPKLPLPRPRRPAPQQ